METFHSIFRTLCGTRQIQTRHIGASVVLRDLLCLVPLIFAMIGCQADGPASKLPTKFKVENTHLKIVSDGRLPKSHPVWKDLDTLRSEILETLELPEPRRQVVVYLFGDEGRYRRFLQAAYPSLPPRRAYFVGTSKELAVYAYVGNEAEAEAGHRLKEDLRHEYTHGVLHAALKDVPLWLDEGLAEYFETPRQVLRNSSPLAVRANNHDVSDKGNQTLEHYQPQYHTRMAAQIANGWRPDLDRLEQMTRVEQMGQEEYQEAWAWTHFLIQGDPNGRAALVDYLQNLATTSSAGSLAARLRSELPRLDDRMLSHMASLGGTGHWMTSQGIEQTSFANE